MIYFRNNGEIREKYEVTYDKLKLEELKRLVATRCGELSIVRDLRKYGFIPQNDVFREGNDSLYHYYSDVKYKVSGKKTTEWDHYDEYEVDLYNCEYKDYICPELVKFIEGIIYSYYRDTKCFEKLFNKDFSKINSFPKVKEKIMSLQDEMARITQEYVSQRQKKVEELNQSYKELIESSADVEKHIKKLNAWINKTKKELLNMDKKHATRMKELNDRLEYLFSIEKLNENQEDLSKYIDELVNLVAFRLVDTISLKEIERVKSFQSSETSEKEMKLVKKN